MYHLFTIIYLQPNFVVIILQAQHNIDWWGLITVCQHVISSRYILISIIYDNHSGTERNSDAFLQQN